MVQKSHECVSALGIHSKQRRSSSLVSEVKELKEEGFHLDFKGYGRFRSALPQRTFVYNELYLAIFTILEIKIKNI